MCTWCIYLPFPSCTLASYQNPFFVFYSRWLYSIYVTKTCRLDLRTLLRALRVLHSMIWCHNLTIISHEQLLLDFMDNSCFCYSSPAAIFEYVLRKKEENLHYCLVVSMWGFFFFFLCGYFIFLFFSSETLFYSWRLVLYFVYLVLHVKIFVMFNHSLI